MANTKDFTGSIQSAQVITRISPKSQREYSIVEITVATGEDSYYKYSFFPTPEQLSLFTLASTVSASSKVNVQQK